MIVITNNLGQEMYVEFQAGAVRFTIGGSSIRVENDDARQLLRHLLERFG